MWGGFAAHFFALWEKTSIAKALPTAWYEYPRYRAARRTCYPNLIVSPRNWRH